MKADTSVRRAAIVAAGVSMLIFLGCMSLNIGGRTYQQSTSDASPADGVFAQEGTVHVKGDSDLDIYYPVPYQRPPNLVLAGEHQACDLVEQKEDHFRVHNPRGFPVDVTWKARGLRLQPQVPAPTNAEASATPPPDPTPSR